MIAYADFIAGKAHSVDASPIPPCGDLLPSLKPHQADIVRWALRRGRAAVFADTGLGKTLMQLEWARHASAHGRVLILAPLAVAEQTVAEAHTFGIVGVRYLREDDGETRIVVANYEMLSHFDPDDFCAVVLDESSILKAFDGKTRTAIIDAFKETPWRLACTATPAPNDFTELGNHSEFLGVRTRAEMLSEFFYHDGGDTSEWALKGHAEDAFWRWVCAWGCIVKRPSDLGHSDEGFILPPLRFHDHAIVVDDSKAREAGMLFAEEARTLSDQRATRRATMDERVTIAASVCNGTREPVLVWCELNAESEAVRAAVPDAVEVAGSDSPEVKAERLIGFAAGRYRVMVTKPSIAGFGLNWQHCARMVFVGASHSYEATYQAVRRCWRFGQTRPVDVHTIYADTEGPVIANLRRKERDADRLSSEVVKHMQAFQRDAMASAAKQWDAYAPSVAMEVPSWCK
jgi:hypothetical protein